MDAGLSLVSEKSFRVLIGVIDSGVSVSPPPREEQGSEAESTEREYAEFKLTSEASRGVRVAFAVS